MNESPFTTSVVIRLPTRTTMAKRDQEVSSLSVPPSTVCIRHVALRGQVHQSLRERYCKVPESSEGTTGTATRATPSTK